MNYISLTINVLEKKLGNGQSLNFDISAFSPVIVNWNDEDYPKRNRLNLQPTQLLGFVSCMQQICIKLFTIKIQSIDWHSNNPVIRNLCVASTAFGSFCAIHCFLASDDSKVDTNPRLERIWRPQKNWTYYAGDASCCLVLRKCKKSAKTWVAIL